MLMRVVIEAVRMLSEAQEPHLRPQECSGGHDCASRGRESANRGCESDDKGSESVVEAPRVCRGHYSVVETVRLLI